MRRTGILAISLLLACSVAGAADYTWGGNTANWDVAAEWVPATGPPGTGDTGVIDIGLAIANADLPGTPAEILITTTVGSSGVLRLDVDGLADHNLVLDGGRLEKTPQTYWTARVYDHELKIKSDSEVGQTNASYGTGIRLEGPVEDYDGANTGVVTINSNFSLVVMAAGSGFTGGWSVQQGTLAAGWKYYDDYYPAADGALGTGSINVSGTGELRLVGSQSSLPNILVTGPDATLGLGGRQSPYYSYDVGGGNSVTINGGRIGGSSTGSYTLAYADFPVNFIGNCKLVDGNSETVVYNDDFVGDNSVTLTYVGRSSGGGETHLNKASNVFEGNYVLDAPQESHKLRVMQDGAMGMGTGQSVTIDGGTLIFHVEQTKAPDSIVVNAGGVIQSFVSRGVSPLSVSFELAGGTMRGTDDYDDATVTPEYSGTVVVSADSYVDTTNSRDLYVSGALTGAGKLTKVGTRTLYMSNTGAGWTGGIEVQAGTLQVDVGGALGSGTATAAGGTIRANISDAFASASKVVSAENGTVDLNNFEQNNALLHIMPGGGFEDGGGFGGALSYDKTATVDPSKTNVLVEKGCILDQNLSSEPDPGDLLPGDGGFGVFLAATSGNWDVGTASGGIFRGLGATSGAPTYGGIVTETAGGTEGLGMLATGPATFTYQNSTLSPDSGNAIKLYGAGRHVFGAGNTLGGDIEKYGPGIVELAADSAISGRELRVYDGVAEIGHANALGGAAALTVKPGGIFNNKSGEPTPTAGTITVEAGGTLAIDADEFDARLASTATWDIQAGANLGMTDDGTFAMPANPVNLYAHVEWGNSRVTTTLSNGMVLTGDTRISSTWDSNYAGWPMVQAAAGQKIDASVSGGRIVARTGHEVEIGGEIDFSGQTLVIGDPDPFLMPRSDGSGFVEVVGDGTVDFDGPNPTVLGTGGKIDIQAGTLSIETSARLGGAAEVHVASGAMLRHWPTGNTFAGTVFSGSGRIWNAYSNYARMEMKPTASQGSGFSPGDGVGDVAVLTLDRFRPRMTANAGIRPTLTIDVVGTSAVPGKDHDQLKLINQNGSWNEFFSSRPDNTPEADLVLRMPVPSVNLKPANFAASGTIRVVDSNAPTGYDDNLGAAVAGNFNALIVEGPTPEVIAHWDIDASQIDYSDPTKVDVVLTPGDWTGHPGDSTLDDAVDVFDLSDLANNYQVPGFVDWTTADYNLSGYVDVYDLAILANNYGWTIGGGGDPVPEPATLGLIVLGALAVIRRRRR